MTGLVKLQLPASSIAKEVRNHPQPTTNFDLNILSISIPTHFPTIQVTYDNVDGLCKWVAMLLGSVNGCPRTVWFQLAGEVFLTCFRPSWNRHYETLSVPKCPVQLSRRVHLVCWCSRPHFQDETIHQRTMWTSLDKSTRGCGTDKASNGCFQQSPKQLRKTWPISWNQAFPEQLLAKPRGVAISHAQAMHSTCIPYWHQFLININRFTATFLSLNSLAEAG